MRPLWSLRLGVRADGDVCSGGRTSERLIKTIKTVRDTRDTTPDSHVSRDCLQKVFPVEHFGVDFRGESGSPCAPSGPFFLRAPLRGGEALRAARAPGKLALSWWSDQQRERPPAGAGSGERARAACMGFRDVVVGALRPSGSAGSTGGRRACWTWTCGSAGGRVAGRRRAWSRRGAGRCSVTAGSSSSAAVVEAAARSRRSSTPEQTRDGRPSKASARRAPEVLHQRAHSKKSGR